MYMEKRLQELFWAPITFKRYQNTSGCGTATFTGHFMLDQNNNNKTAVPTAKIQISELSVETQYTFFDSVCLYGSFLGSVCNWRDVPGYQESSKALYRHQHESDRKGRVRG